MQTASQIKTQDRYHPRVEANLTVKLLVDGRVVPLQARDLSMAGLFLVGSPALQRERVTIALPLPGDREIVASCLVRRSREQGLALEFEYLDWDDLFALARFLHPRLPD